MMKILRSKTSIGTVLGLILLVIETTCIPIRMAGQTEGFLRGARLAVTTTASGETDRIYIARDHEVQCLDRVRNHVIWTSPVPHGTVDVGPVVSDKAVIYVSGDMSTVRSLDIDTGSLKWSADIQSAHMTSDRKAVFLTTSTGMGVQALDAENGKKLWKYEPEGAGSIFQLLYTNGKIYTDSYVLNAENGQLLRTNVSTASVLHASAGSVFWATSRGSVEALNAISSKTEWNRTTARGIRPIALCANSQLLFFAGYNGMPFVARTGTLEAFDVGDGHLVWEIPLKSNDNGLQPNPIASDQDGVYLLSPSSETTTRLTDFRSASGQEVWGIELKGQLEDPPLVVGEEIYVTDGPDVIYEIEKASGKILRRDELPKKY